MHTTVLTRGPRRYRIRSWYERPIGTPLRVVDAHLVRDLVADSFARRALARIASEHSPGSGAMSDRELARCIENLLARARIAIDEELLYARVPRAPLGENEPSDAPPPRTQGAHWIEVELIDHAGEPVRDRSFVLIAPDGTRIAGRLDRDGRARVEGLPETQYRIGFPALAADAWARA